MEKSIKELVDNVNDVKNYIDTRLALMIATACLLFAGMIALVVVVVHEVSAETVAEAENPADAPDLAETPAPTPATEVATVAESEPAYSESDAILLAQVMLNEAGGVPSQTEQSMVAWTVLNRVDDGRFGGSIYEVLAAPAQFAWWSGTAVRDDLLELARDILSRYGREKAGETSVGRTLPKDRLYFYGDGVHNYFYSSSGGDAAYSFSECPSPYES